MFCLFLSKPTYIYIRVPMIYLKCLSTVCPHPPSSCALVPRTFANTWETDPAAPQKRPHLHFRQHPGPCCRTQVTPRSSYRCQSFNWGRVLGVFSGNEGIVATVANLTLHRPLCWGWLNILVYSSTLNLTFCRAGVMIKRLKGCLIEKKYKFWLLILN